MIEKKRIKGGEYLATHKETGRQFHIVQTPSRWDWRAFEIVEGVESKKPIQLSKDRFKWEIWSLHELLDLLEAAMAPAPVVKPIPATRKEVAKVEQQVRTMADIVPTIGEHSWTKEGDLVVVVFKRDPNKVRYIVTKDAEGWWYAKEEGDRQFVVTKMWSKVDLLRELTWIATD